MEKLHSREPPIKGRVSSLGEAAIGISWNHEGTELSRSVVSTLFCMLESPGSENTPDACVPSPEGDLIGLRAAWVLEF